MGEKSIKAWVDIVLKNHPLSSCEFECEGQTNEGDGYGSNIIFFKLTGFNEVGSKETLHLAVKSSKENTDLTKQAFLKEMFIYGEVKSQFLKLLEENFLPPKFDFLAYCYAMNSTKNLVLVFENLRLQGFQLWDKKLPMTFKHVQLVLEAYGQWHAYSVVLKKQKPAIFHHLIQKNINMFTYVNVQMNFGVIYADEYQNTVRTVMNSNEKTLLKTLLFSQDNIKDAFTNMFDEDPDYHVILHGDCWNNNFLFKVMDDKEKPSEVRVLDWQLSGFGSPVFDLSYFIYCCVDTGKSTIKDLLEVYYQSFSKHVALFGCQPEELFSFEKLAEHWKKFSHFGLVLSASILKVCVMNELPWGEKNTDQAAIEAYQKRVRNNFLHYCTSVQ